MKATGIVRRIDDLGRVVIPKEIRRTMRIREGDPLYTSLLHTLKPASLLGFQGINKNLTKFNQAAACEFRRTLLYSQ